MESKLDASSPKNQFKINGYKCFRCDPNKYGGGFIFYLANQTVLPDVEISLLDISLTFWKYSFTGWSQHDHRKFTS